MKSLLRFLSRNYFVLLFLTLESISLILVLRYNNYQNVKFFNSSTYLVARFYETFNSAFGYFRLHQVNSELAAENARLKNELQEILHPEKAPVFDNFVPDALVPDSLRRDSVSKDSVNRGNMLPADTAVKIAGDSIRIREIRRNLDVRYRFIPARVINNSVNRQNNYITINKGRLDGVKPEMGIVGPNGIVGIITNVTDHYATGPTVLNKRWRVSAKIKKSSYFGSLNWDGLDYRTAQLNEIPFHVELTEGDTLVTSGYSSVFPEGIMIGRIEKFEIGSGDNFYQINVRLSTNFKTLTHVEIIDDKDIGELKTLEKIHLND